MQDTFQHVADDNIGHIFLKPDSSYQHEYVVKLYTRDGYPNLLNVEYQDALIVKAVLDCVIFLLLHDAPPKKHPQRKKTEYNQKIGEVLRRLAHEHPEMPRNLRMQTAVAAWKAYVADGKHKTERLKKALDEMQ
jgi:hypothetical protein